MVTTPIPPPDEELHFAMQQLIRYVRQFHSVNEGQIAGGGNGLTQDIVRNYINRASKRPEHRNGIFTQLYPRMREVLQDTNLVPDTHSVIEPVIRKLYPTEERDDVSPGALEIERTDLRLWSALNGDMATNIIRNIAGMWRVARLSSSRWEDSNTPEFALCLLVVFSPEINRERLPYFKLYSRGKYSNKSTYETFEGFILVQSTRIYFIGTSATGERNLIKIVWPYRQLEDNNHHETAIGLIATINSNHVPISTYGAFEFLKGTENVKGEEYAQRKDEERRTMAVYPIEKVKEYFTDVTMIDNIAKWAQDDSVFFLKT